MVKLERQTGHRIGRFLNAILRKQFRLDPIVNGDPAKDFFKVEM